MAARARLLLVVVAAATAAAAGDGAAWGEEDCHCEGHFTSVPLQLASHSRAGVTYRGRRNTSEAFHGGTSIDMNGRPCDLCGAPLTSRSDRDYVQRTDCGNHSIRQHPEARAVPIISFNREATDTQPATTAWCELNTQKMCADGLYNKDLLYQAKAVDYPRQALYDPWYCHYNGWTGNPTILALQHDFDGLLAYADEQCHTEKYLQYGWNTNMTMNSFGWVYGPGVLRGKPKEWEGVYVGAWTCAMGTAACDMAYCAYSFCEKGVGEFGMYEECEGWDPVKGMPVRA